MIADITMTLEEAHALAQELLDTTPTTNFWYEQAIVRAKLSLKQVEAKQASFCTSAALRAADLGDRNA